jgi:cobalamin biosynthesis protein CobD/CbiB
MDHDRKAQFQLVWGILLVMAGVGLLFRIPQVMPQIRQIEYFSGVIPFIYFCFYFMALFLIAGGAKKIYANYKKGTSGKPT